jgi:hypothetical protein
VAELGLDAFTPYLLGIIRNQDPSLMSHLIGSASGEVPVNEDMHEMGILPPEVLGSGKLVAVKFHLFATSRACPFTTSSPANWFDRPQRMPGNPRSELLWRLTSMEVVEMWV